MIERTTRPTIGDGLVVDYRSTEYGASFHLSASRNAVVVHHAELRRLIGEPVDSTAFVDALDRAITEHRTLERGGEVER